MLHGLRAAARNVVPEEVRQSSPYRTVARWVKRLDGPVNKLDSEMSYWRGRYEAEGGRLQNTWYERIVLSIANEDDTSFVDGKIVADFGCGPRGSLCWASSARARIGIDVLADRYMEFGAREHDMTYILSSEDWIPLPTAYVDVMITLNAMDHVENFEQMCGEVLRVLRPGGTFIASFNLHEPPTPTEPLMLDEPLVHRNILDHLDIESYRTGARCFDGNNYKNMFEGRNDPLTRDQEGYLWVRAKRR